MEIGPDLALNPTVIFGADRGKRFLIESTGTGAAILDFDNDSRNDLLVLQGTRLEFEKALPPALLLYRKLQNGSYEEVSKRFGLAMTGWAQGVCTGDIDNDGWTDLFVTAYGVSRFFRNHNGTFVDETSRANFPVTGVRWGAGCTFTDYDRDGLLDLFVANYVDFDLKTAPLPGSRPECIWRDIPIMCGPKGLPMASNILYRNLGDRRFEDVSAKAGILKPGKRYGLGVAAADFNRDGWPDLYVACDQTPSLLYQNRKDGTFEERGVEAGVALDSNGRTQAGMGVAVGDFDHNGFLDIAKTNFSGELPSLYLNEDGEFFHDVAEPAGLGVNQLLGWGIAFLDYDEDGHPDLVMANGHFYPEVAGARMGDTYRQPSLLYRNAGNGKFTDVTRQAGGALAKERVARGLAMGDLDGDARPELVIVNMNEPLTVLTNDNPRGNWVRMRFQGTRSNRSAFGTQVTIEAGGIRQTAELMSGSSYFSQNEPALYFGLGKASAIDRITIRWPLGQTQECRGVSANRTLDFTEGAPCAPK